jgi:hypothetical protein
VVWRDTSGTMSKISLVNVVRPITNSNVGPMMVQGSAAWLEGQSTFYTSTVLWLSGVNVWGLHQDLRFASPLSAVRQGLRIMQAAEKVRHDLEERFELSREDLGTIIAVMKNPRPMKLNDPLSAPVAREALVVLEHLEKAWDELRVEEKAADSATRELPAVEKRA